MFYKYPKLFQDPKIDYPINNPDLDFAHYITLTKKSISDHHFSPDFSTKLALEYNSPFQLQPLEYKQKNIKKGALLIHGLLDTPFVMKDIGKELQKNGLLVRSILLPGHGTVPGNLLNVKFEDWLQALRYGIHPFSKEVDQIYLVGFSTGASLSFYQTLLDPSFIAGLILLAPAFKIRSPLAHTSNWHTFISKHARAKWFHICKEIDYTKYSSIPYNAIYQVYRLSRAIKKLSLEKSLSSPLFINISTNDRIICSSAAKTQFLQTNNPKNKLLIYSDEPLNYKDPRILIRNSVYPELKIANFSHICLPVSPDNPHYGKQGDYPLASHVDEKNHYIYGALDKSQQAFFDLLYKLKVVPYQKRRLTFNPDFDFLIKEIIKFLDVDGAAKYHD